MRAFAHSSRNIADSYVSDNNGNRTQRQDSVNLQTTTYGYNQEDRLIGINPGGLNAPQYGYNGDGLRMTKSQGMGVTRFS